MILESVELKNVGPFRETVRVGPLDPGLNILAASNETGKSTLVKAGARALFDSHGGKSKEIKELRPAGTSLAPSVAVVFRCKSGNYRIEKTFLESPRSQLSQMVDGQWRPLGEADQADRRVRELLGSEKPGAGATKPEHWGLFRYLWARQGEAVAWPEWDGEAAKLVRARLARVEIDPLIERLKSSFWSEYEKNFTPAQGQPKAGGPLAFAEKELGDLKAELKEVRGKARELEELQIRFQGFSEQTTTFEQEARKLKEKADEIGQQARQVELLLPELRAHEKALEAARKEFHRVDGDLRAAREAQDALQGLKKEMEQSEQRQQELKDAEVENESLLTEADGALQEVHHRRAGLQAELERVQGLLKLRRLKDALVDLQKKLQEAESQAAALSRLQEEKSKIPGLTPQKLGKLKGLDQDIRELDAQIKVVGITMDLTPDKASRVEVTESGAKRSLKIQGGVTETLSSGQALRVRLEGWGEVRVRSGAGELKDLEERRREAQAELSKALAELGVENVEQAASLLEKRKDLDGRIREATQDLKRALGDFDDLDGLKARMNQSDTEHENLRKSLHPESGEDALSISGLEAQEETLKPGLRDVEKTIQRDERALKELADKQASCREERHLKGTELAKLSEQTKSHERKIEETRARYPEGIEVMKARAGDAFTEAETRVESARRKLPPDYEKLPEGNRRAAAAFGEAQRDLEKCREDCQRLRGTLEALGAEGLYSRESQLLEEIGVKKAEADAARRRGWAARLLHDLMERRKQAATRQVLTPLEDQLSSVFAELTGVSVRRIFLDENLQIRGAGRSEEELLAFDLLSQGAKEQLMLALRLAVAQALTETEPQAVILDDVLANTDPVRQARVLDVLQAAAQRMQLLVLTCHPDHYRGVGKVVSIERCGIP
ncbi:MAG: AAA family ATPase [Planctomycetes bacterium]|nr:AAA family ATPase [Planctomycetota bacterium]